MELAREIEGLHPQMVEWRRDLHAHPELGFQEERTSEFVASKLEEWGIEVHRGLAGTGVVGVLRAGESPRTVGIRADMDALPIEERGASRAHASRHRGRMHACGHDGHTTMLLAAAQCLATAKRFDGTVHFIFQPAEEGAGGGLQMVREGLFDRFPCDTVWALHNIPGIAAGRIAVAPGPMMAARDNFDIRIQGRGSHAAMPHQGVDPIVVGAQLVTALQTLASRSVDPLETLVLSITQFQAGDTYNVIPDTARIAGTCRFFSQSLKESLPDRIRKIVDGVCAAFGATATLEYVTGYPATVNSEPHAELAAEVAEHWVGADRVYRNPRPAMGSEDFSYMLLERPGAYIWIGNGDGAGLHHPEYDFNDDVLGVGAGYWVRLVERLLAAKS